MKRILIAIIPLILIASCSKKAGKSPADISGHVAWVDGRAGLPVFPFGTNPIYMFVTDYSTNCQKMDKRVFARPEIIDFINHHFTSIWVPIDSIDTVQFLGQDYTREQLIQEFKIENYPVHLFFNMRGDLKGIRDGYIAQEEFKKLLRYVAEGYVEKYDFSTFLNMPESKVDTSWGDF